MLPMLGSPSASGPRRLLGLKGLKCSIQKGIKGIIGGHMGLFDRVQRKPVGFMLMNLLFVKGFKFHKLYQLEICFGVPIYGLAGVKLFYGDSLVGLDYKRTSVSWASENHCGGDVLQPKRHFDYLHQLGSDNSGQRLSEACMK